MTALIPQPQSILPGEGRLHLTAASTLQADAEFVSVAMLLQRELRASTGFEWPIVAHGGTVTLLKQSGLGSEGYGLDVTTTGARVTAESPAGAFYGTRTLLQLLPPEVFSKTTVSGVEWMADAVRIEDAPRFTWRGSHFDVGRHFFDKKFVLRYLDLMALHKLNVLQFHLTEDQGWRMEIKRYPKLTEVGAWRSDTMLKYDPPSFTGEPHGGFYTQEELREIVAYAAERFITVVPEIEMPGHATAAIAAYPELGNGEGPIPVATTWGVLNTILNVEDSTIEFFKNVLDEVLEVFPSPFIHIGGDECPKDEWKASASAQKRIQDEGLADEDELQSWFIRQMDVYLASKGRRLVGWSEILEGGLAPGATLMVWLGTEGAVSAVQSGHDVVMAQYSHLYFDYSQDPDAVKPGAWMSVSTLEHVYGYNAIPEGVTEAQAKHILGLQYQLWTEYIPTEERLEYMAFPRACAASEIAWTQPAALDYGDFKTRLSQHLRRLDVFGVNYARVGEEFSSPAGK